MMGRCRGGGPAAGQQRLAAVPQPAPRTNRISLRELGLSWRWCRTLPAHLVVALPMYGEEDGSARLSADLAGGLAAYRAMRLGRTGDATGFAVFVDGPTCALADPDDRAAVVRSLSPSRRCVLPVGVLGNGRG